MGIANIRVTEVDRQGGQTHITLGMTYVTGEKNIEDEAWLDEAEARTLIAELQAALLMADETLPDLACVLAGLDTDRARRIARQMFFGNEGA